MNKVLALAIVISTTTAVPASAIMLQDGNSTVSIKPNPWQSPSGLGEGLYSWTIGQSEVLDEEWFWIRVDEEPIYSLVGGTTGIADTNGTGMDDTISMRFGGPSRGVVVDLTTTLRGGTPNSGASDVAQIVEISNPSSEALSISFFQYAFFEIGGGPNVLEIVSPNSVRQYNGDFEMIEVVGPTPDRSQVDFWPDLEDQISDGIDLDGSVGPLEGYVSYAFQWDFELDPGKTFLLSKNMIVRGAPVPEPATVLLLATGLLGVARRRLRR